MLASIVSTRLLTLWSRAQRITEARCKRMSRKTGHRPVRRGTSADRPRDARSPEEPGRAQFPYTPPAAFTGTGASNGDVARLTSLVLGRSKAESAGLVFTMESGTAVDPRSAVRAISTAAKALGMSGVGMHRLRHS